MAAIASSAQTLTTLINFNGTTGGFPSPLVQGFDGKLYGTTWTYGANGSGTAFKTTLQGGLTTLHNFCSETNCADGTQPSGVPLTLGKNGSLYGGTLAWGTNNDGTVFSTTESGQLTTLYNLGGANGPASHISLLQMNDGAFYATSRDGGGTCAINGAAGCGTLFKMSPTGVVATLYNFCSRQQKGGNCPDGAFPANLILGLNGYLYGTTEYGGTFNEGTIFQVTPSGQFSILYNFCSQTGCADGFGPTSLFQATDGNLYGTSGGGTNNYGTIFRLTVTGTLTTLYRFCSVMNCTDGYQPVSLLEASDGNLYGTSYGGGTDLGGTIFQLTLSGNLTTLYSFSLTDGRAPIGIIQDTDGNFYGATTNGGSSNDGTVFRLATGLGPFVKSVRGYGRVGQSGGILGQGFTGTTGVFLNGTPANFTVVSDTYIQATVPVGGTTGYITVDTPSGTLKSNVPFQVNP